LQPTALVHEAYLRLVGSDPPPNWNGRTHFFAAAAEAMRRILVEQARRKKSSKRGGGRQRVELDHIIQTVEPNDLLLDIDDALTKLREVDPAAAQLVSLRYFAGMTMEEAAQALELPLRTVERNWTFARAWLHRALSDTASAEGE
jgi:RNA polymerase sigma factor (TIGR02999 family)